MGIRCIEEYHRLNIENQALYGIIQGGIYPEYRNISAELITTNIFLV